MKSEPLDEQKILRKIDVIDKVFQIMGYFVWLAFSLWFMWFSFSFFGGFMTFAFLLLSPLVGFIGFGVVIIVNIEVNNLILFLYLRKKDGKKSV